MFIMLTTADQKKIREIIQDETEGMKLSLAEIERDRKILKDIWDFVKSHTVKIQDHEERIIQLESSSKF